MFQLPKSVLSFVVGAGTLGAFILTAPKAAHALVATLVQVTNTPTNPAVAQSPNTQARQLIELSTGSLVAPGSSAYNQLVVNQVNGDDTPQYSVPANLFLVITSADVTSTNGGGGTCVNPANVSFTQGGPNRAVWLLAAGQGTSHFTYPSGIVFPGGATPYIHANTGCYTYVQLQGYYTTN